MQPCRGGQHHHADEVKGGQRLRENELVKEVGAAHRLKPVAHEVSSKLTALPEESFKVWVPCPGALKEGCYPSWSCPHRAKCPDTWKIEVTGDIPQRYRHAECEGDHADERRYRIGR